MSADSSAAAAVSATMTTNSSASTSIPIPSTPPHVYNPGVSRVGWIGTGVMGESMAGHILAMQAPAPPATLTVYNRTLAKTEGLKAKGARVATSPEDVAKNSDIVFSIVAFPSDVRRVLMDAVIPNLKPGAIVVDMTTSEPTLARELAEFAASRGVWSIDAPVSGGDIGARNASLSIMIGGEKQAMDAVTPLFQAMGKNLTHCGGAGAGQHTKMVNQILIASGMVGVVEGLLYAQRSGLDPLRTIQAVQAGAAGSWSISNLGPKIINRDWTPGFFVEHFIKDLNIALAESKRMGIKLPGLELATKLYERTAELGASRSATTALMLALEDMNKQQTQQ